MLNVDILYVHLNFDLNKMHAVAWFPIIDCLMWSGFQKCIWDLSQLTLANYYHTSLSLFFVFLWGYKLIFVEKPQAVHDYRILHFIICYCFPLSVVIT